MLLVLAITATVLSAIDLRNEAERCGPIAIVWHGIVILALWVLYVHCGVVNCE